MSTTAPLPGPPATRRDGVLPAPQIAEDHEREEYGTRVGPPTDTKWAAPAASVAAPGRGSVVPALLLIGLGVFFLIANLVDGGGRLLFFALGVAFLVARVLTGRYGFAVPAGLLLGFGSFVLLEGYWPAGEGAGAAQGGWFFVLLGLGFLAVYLIGARPALVWPLFPAAGLVGFGVLLMGAVVFEPLAPLAWIGAYWPLALALVGAWLLVRERVPARLRRPTEYAGGILIVAYTIVAAAAAIAAAR
ncbi:MAG: hypothetical protein HY332_14010 [Chloroflexi bacterium]|nr:hypothetical protein [Chloroflexota bacterium]